MAETSLQSPAPAGIPCPVIVERAALLVDVDEQLGAAVLSVEGDDGAIFRILLSREGLTDVIMRQIGALTRLQREGGDRARLAAGRSRRAVDQAGLLGDLPQTRAAPAAGGPGRACHAKPDPWGSR
jgi:hypothetical protein